jgi:hypothetical protein
VNESKSPAEVEQLKRNWRVDPCYDIEETPGFEAHYDELLDYRRTVEAQWKADQSKYWLRIRRASTQSVRKMSQLDHVAAEVFVRSMADWPHDLPLRLAAEQAWEAAHVFWGERRGV